MQLQFSNLTRIVKVVSGQLERILKFLKSLTFWRFLYLECDQAKLLWLAFRKLCHRVRFIGHQSNSVRSVFFSGLLGNGGTCTGGVGVVR